MIRALALSLLASSVAMADDAPRVVVLTEVEAVAAARRVVACEARVTELEKRESPPPSLALIALALVGGVVAGGLIGVGVGYALAPR